MKITHDPSLDYLSIDFKDEVESRSTFENGMIVRYDKRDNVIGVDITDSFNFFLNSQTVSLQEACRLLGISESTLRRRIKAEEIPYSKLNKKYYRFKKSDILKLIA